MSILLLIQQKGQIMATTNSSPILRKARLKNTNKIPNDFYQVDIFVYSIVEIEGDEVSCL